MEQGPEYFRHLAESKENEDDSIVLYIKRVYEMMKYTAEDGYFRIDIEFDVIPCKNKIFYYTLNDEQKEFVVNHFKNKKFIVEWNDDDKFTISW